MGFTCLCGIDVARTNSGQPSCIACALGLVGNINEAMHSVAKGLDVASCGSPQPTCTPALAHELGKVYLLVLAS